MNTITNHIPVTSAEYERSLGVTFGQKQTWFKEMEKARQLLGNNKENNDSQTVQVENKHASDDRNAVVNPTITAQGSAALGDMSGIQLSNPLSSQQANAMLIEALVNAPARSSLANPAVENVIVLKLMLAGSTDAQPKILQTARSYLEEALRGEIQAQNLQLIKDKDGVRVLFRDYRMDAEEMKRVIQKIKEVITSLGMQVLDVTVNGNVIEQNNSVTQEAS